MKIDRHDQGKILSALELSRLFTIGLKSPCDRALFEVSHRGLPVDHCIPKMYTPLMAALDPALPSGNVLDLLIAFKLVAQTHNDW